jgi:hypothetical protein
MATIATFKIPKIVNEPNVSSGIAVGLVNYAEEGYTNATA